MPVAMQSRGAAINTVFNGEGCIHDKDHMSELRLTGSNPIRGSECFWALFVTA